MPDSTQPKDPAALWKAQPEEKRQVNLEQIVNRRAEELYSSTRSEILMSIGAALLFAAVMALRVLPNRSGLHYFSPDDGLLRLGIGTVIAWAVISLYWFRGWIWPRGTARPDAAAATGLDYYRKELERRRDHLRNAWVWHGPLFLSCLILAGILTGKGHLGFDRFQSALPLVILLAVWTGFGLWRRLRQARDLQREIDEIQRG